MIPALVLLADICAHGSSPVKLFNDNTLICQQVRDFTAIIDSLNSTMRKIIESAVAPLCCCDIPEHFELIGHEL